MERFEDEQQLCPCYKECQEFLKLVELKDSGLVVYSHRPRTKHIRQAEVVESAGNTSKYVFILYNKTNMELTTSELTLEREKENIRCPRCRKTFEHAQDLMQEVKSIAKKMILGICDHCRKKAQGSKIPFCVCDEIVKKFISVKGEQKGKILPSKMGHLGKNVMINKEHRSPPFDDQINLDLAMPASKHDPAVQDMFSLSHFKSDDTELGKTHLKEDYVKPAVASIQPNEPVTNSARTPHEDENINTITWGNSLADSVTTSVDLKELPKPTLKDHKQWKISDDIPSLEAKEALKSRQDGSRQMERLEKDSGVLYFDTKYETPDIDETSKISQWTQKEPTSKYMEFEMDIKKTTLKQDRRPHGPRGARVYVSNRDVKFRSRPSQQSFIAPRKVSKHHYDKIKQGLYDSEETPPKQVKKLKDRFIVDKELKPKHREDKISNKTKKLEQHVAKSKYKFIFPKVKEKEEKRRKMDVTSSQLIKDTQARLQTAKEKRRQQTDRKDKEKRLQTEDEKRLQAEEVKRQAIEKKVSKAQAPEKEKASEKIRDASGSVKVSLQKIMNTLKKENSGKREIVILKQGKGKESESKILKKDPSKTLENIYELQKLQTAHFKEKEEALKKKNQLQYKAEVEKLKDAERISKKDEVDKKNIAMLKESPSTNLKSVKIKQAKKTSPSNISPDVLKTHKCHHQHSGKKSPVCHLCANSDLELEVLSLDNKKKVTAEKSDIIIGEKIFQHKPHLEKIQESKGGPILFQKELCVEPGNQPNEILQIIPQKTKFEEKQIQSTKAEMEQGKGVIRYALSDRTFIEKGWTMLPTEKIVRKMNVYRMRPSHPEFDWFEHNKNKPLMTYDTGERLAEFDDNGRGRWYYRNGRLALDYYDAEEANAQQRIVIYSSGEPDERGRTHPITILATFDYLGNGVVFDHTGKIRLKYNQTEGVVLDRKIGPVSHWQWHSLNDPPVLQQVMIDTQMAIKDPDILQLGPSDTTTRPDNEEMLAIEFDNFIKEKSKKLSQKFKPFQIRMKALKINEQFSLKVLDQATVHLNFRDGSTNLKLNIGMILDPQEIVNTDTADVGKVSNSLERFPVRTDSLAGLQRSVLNAQRYERQRANRERWLVPPVPSVSAEQLTAAASPPMRLPLRTVPTRSSSCTGYCSRKPTNNLYYDTRRC